MPFKVTERKTNGLSWERAERGAQRNFALAQDAPPARVPGWLCVLVLCLLIGLSYYTK